MILSISGSIKEKKQNKTPQQRTCLSLEFWKPFFPVGTNHIDICKNLVVIRREHSIFWNFLGGSEIKNQPSNPGDTADVSVIPGSGRSHGTENGNLLQYPYLEKSHGQRILAGHSPWGHKELDMTERLHYRFFSNYPSVCSKRGSPARLWMYLAFIANTEMTY